MASLRAQVVGLAVVAIVVVAMNGNVKADCTSDVQQLNNVCASTVMTGTPSDECCGLIRSADFNCVCSQVTPDVAAIINAQQIGQILAFCGRPVPHPFQCGSLTIP